MGEGLWHRACAAVYLAAAVLAGLVALPSSPAMGLPVLLFSLAGVVYCGWRIDMES